MKNNDLNIVDLFDEELNKKEKMKLKKIKKEKIKEEKKEKKKQKKFEQDEDLAFNKYLEEIKKEELIEASKDLEKIDFKQINEIKNVDENNEKKKKYPVLNFFIGLFSIILLVISCDYLFYNCIKKYTNFSVMINSIILITTIIFYILSIIVKKESFKKCFQLLSIVCFSLFMLYYLFNA